MDAALLFFNHFKELATDKECLALEKSKSDPCLFHKRNEEGMTIGVIVVYVDNCVITGEKHFIDEMKSKLKIESGDV